MKASDIIRERIRILQVLLTMAEGMEANAAPETIEAFLWLVKEALLPEENCQP